MFGTKRYRLVCVAPEMPDNGSYDDLDEAIYHSDGNYEVYDTQAPKGESPWVGAYSMEDWQDAADRHLARLEQSRAR